MSLYGAMAGVVSASQEIEPHRMSFGSVTSPSYFDPIPSGLNDFSNTFANTTDFTRYTENTQGTFTVASSTAQLAHVANRNDFVALTAHSLTVPQVWVEILVSAIPDLGTVGFDTAGVCLIKDANNYCGAFFDRLNSNAFITTKVAGVVTFSGIVTKAVTAPFSIGFSLVGNSASCWHKPNGGTWTYITGADVTSLYDFRTSGNLTGWRAAFHYGNGNNAGTWQFQNFSAGRFGGVGVRDFTIVTNEDGTPYWDGNLVHFTATTADARGGGNCGLFTIDTTTNAIVQTGVLFVDRSSKLYNDLGAHIVYYSNGDRRLSLATWGNGFGGSIDVIHKLITNGSQGDLLSTKDNVVASMSSLGLPLNSKAGSYDNMLVYDSANSRWLMGYTLTSDTNFAGGVTVGGALAYSTDLSTWTLIGSDVINPGWEGAKIVRANHKYWLIVGGPVASGNNSRIYDSGMNYIGALPGATFSGGTSTLPHPMVFAMPDKRHFMLLTFDNTKYGSASFTWGQPKIMKSPRFW